MNQEYYKEKIRFLTEWLRGLLVISALISSGVVSLLLRYDYSISNIEQSLLIVGTLIFFGLMSAIILINKNINHNINQLQNG